MFLLQNLQKFNQQCKFTSVLNTIQKNDSELHLTVLIVNLNKKLAYSTKTTQSQSNKKYANSTSNLPITNELTLKESKRLMRLVYARVHPDLFTNHLQAQVMTKLCID